MFKIATDASYFEALINKNHENHDLAHEIGIRIKDNPKIYISLEEYSKIIDTFNYCDEKIRKKIRNIIMNNTTIFIPKKENINNAQKYYYTYPDKLSYLDCIIIDYYLKNDIHHIISFDNKWDNIDRIKRVHSIEKANNKIYFPKWYW